jgi:large subunit ribosomal protein L18
MNKKKALNQKKKRRERRIRVKIFGTQKQPRLSVFRSSRYTYCQLINDEKVAVLTGVSTKEITGKNMQSAKKTALAEKLGELIAKKAIEMGIKKAVFDRGKYKYHGRVKAIAEGARKGGLIL